MPALPAVNLTPGQKRQLLTLARNTLAKAFNSQHHSKVTQAPLDDALNRLKLGCFVTLTLEGELKGCMGCIEGDRPLSESIPTLANSSAFSDRRFLPLVESQLKALCIEISLLSEMKRIEVKNQTELQASLEGTSFGLVLKEDDKKAVFLPQVWQQLPEAKEFIEALKAKGGWDRGYWSPNMQVEIFGVTHFSEEKL
ncbi:AmmeMemoRadiSam system protein A [uncultured Shewanella sp.]|uniref:AmmeMemoRadiSam system protein A n=1 Tax=uncultured Shewanella sp. TaxID=173975 RepID=UPI0026215585|nr:AmmeMemoRadiSam system protein A [uncultured Shewanella sp.]